MTIKRIIAPLDRQIARTLHCGDSVLLSGVIYTARDAAHMRLAELVESGAALPFSVDGAVIYYVGPTPEKPGRIIGSAGPTTSYRMDAYTPALIETGLTGMIGKGSRSDEVIEAMQEYGAVYFGAIGGAGALLSLCIKASEVIAYDDLGAEAIRKLTVRDMPLTVVIDSEGKNLYRNGRADYINKQGFIDNKKDDMF